MTSLPSGLERVWSWIRVTQRVSYFFLALVLSMLTTRVFVFADYYLFTRTPAITTRVGSDSIRFHHYWFGFLLMTLAGILALGKRQPAYLVAGLGLGLVLEEWTVLVENLGLHSPIMYFSQLDLVSMLGLVGAAYMGTTVVVGRRIRNQIT